jgi:hypothetical protein
MMREIFLYSEEVIIPLEEVLNPEFLLSFDRIQDSAYREDIAFGYQQDKSLTQKFMDRWLSANGNKPIKNYGLELSVWFVMLRLHSPGRQVSTRRLSTSTLLIK